MPPEIRPKSFGTFEKQAPGPQVKQKGISIPEDFGARCPVVQKTDGSCVITIAFDFDAMI